jgi:hypothetical protein
MWKKSLKFFSIRSTCVTFLINLTNVSNVRISTASCPQCTIMSLYLIDLQTDLRSQSRMAFIMTVLVTDVQTYCRADSKCHWRYVFVTIFVKNVGCWATAMHQYMYRYLTQLSSSRGTLRSSGDGRSSVHQQKSCLGLPCLGWRLVCLMSQRAFVGVVHLVPKWHDI